MISSFRGRRWACVFAASLFLLPLLLHAQTKQIRLRNEVIQTTPAAAQTPGPPAAAPAQPAVSGLSLLQFTGPIQPAWRTEVEALGVELVRYVPDDTYVARLNNVPPGRLRQLWFVQWLGDFRPDHKLHRSLRGQLSAAPGSTPVPVTVLLAPRTSPGNFAAARGLLNSVQQESHLRFGSVLRGNIDPARLNALANSDAVLWIEPAGRPKLFDEESSKIVGGDDGERSTPTVTQSLGYDGSGVVVAVADSGLDTGELTSMHPDLAGRVDAFQWYGSLTDAEDEHSHGTHVTGIIAGNAAIGETDENGALYGLGVAPNAHIVVQRLFDGVGNFEAPPSYETLTRDALSAGAIIGNNSWGEDTQGHYDTTAAEFDALVRDADLLTPEDQPYILEFSAGNAGPGAQTIGTPAIAKNVIATGASQNNRLDLFIYAEGEDAMADFSSRGPCEDGRIKPDVVAPGTWIASARSSSGDDNNAWAEISPNYMFQGGTSQAGPHVAGAAAVFVQYYRQLHTNTPSPALVKAALINSALDLFDELGTDPTPNHDEGWGRVDLTEIIGADRQFVFIDQTNLLSTDATYETAVAVQDPDHPLKITLAYTDVPGFPGAAQALVNDLDLEVIGPDGKLYRGNRFINGESITNSTTPDTINNVEGVYLRAPRPGEYTVRVRGRNVPEDARVDSEDVDQDFALVISGSYVPQGQSLVYLDRTAYRAPDRIFVGVVDRDRAGQPSLTVTMASQQEPGGQTLTLFPKNAAGVFTNSMLTATGAPANDGQLQIAHGNTIEARYNDVSASVLRIATALADLQPPVISAVSVTNRFGRAFISWNTDEPADSRVEYATNTSVGLSASDPVLTNFHSVSPESLIPERTYYYRVISADHAGNRATNSGGLLTFVAPNAPPVLIVDGFFDDFFFDPPPPLGIYTNALNQIGVAHDVWDRQSGGAPTLADLRPYSVVIWRLPEFNFTGYTSWTAAERQAITNYLNEGGSLFVASMEVLSRLTEVGGQSIRTNVLNVVSFTEDVGAISVTGTDGDPIGGGMAFDLDYSVDYLSFDFSDAIVPSGNAQGIFIEDSTEEYAGLRYPRTGVDSPWRAVFLSFPFEAVPEFGFGVTNRTVLLQRILQFLAPGVSGEAVVSVDRTGYRLPAQIAVEVGDFDLSGFGQLTVTARTTTEPTEKTFVLLESSRRGQFRGDIPLVSATNTSLPTQLRGVEGDIITMTYFDASRSINVEVSAVVDITPPIISGVTNEADYSTATIFWDTDDPADTTVQFGESALLNRVAFDSVLTTDHAITLPGLQPDHTYYYRVVSRDSAGNSTTDDNNGNLYTFQTRIPLNPPFVDNFETGATNWSVFSSDESEAQWTLGVPNNGIETAAHSPLNAWGSSLNGFPLSLVDTFLISPAIHLTNSNGVTLRFWHSYDFTERSPFDVVEGGEVLLIETDGNQAITLATYIDSNSGWEQEQISLTPYLGKVVYLVWHHQLLSLEAVPRPGWLVDDIEILGTNIVVGQVIISNNISQATFALTGPTARTSGGTGMIVSNAPAGPYAIIYGTVPYYVPPTPKTNTLSEGGTLQFTGTYTFTDANGNGISDAWEQSYFGGVGPHPPNTDTDHDGASDYAEFAAGTNPTNSASKVVITITPQPNQKLRIKWPTVPGRSYRLLSSTDLSTWTPLTPWKRAAGATMATLLDNPGTAHKTLRVEVKP